jgi:hypothetical protein
MIDWGAFDWETYEAYTAHFADKSIGRSNLSDRGTSLEIALWLASEGQLKRKVEDDYYDLYNKDKITVQAKHSLTSYIILKNGMGDSETKLYYADYYVVANYESKKLFLIEGGEIEKQCIETGADKKKEPKINYTKCKKKLIWVGKPWKILNDSSDSWFTKKHDAFCDLWYTCKNNVKQQSPLGAFIQ